MLWLPGRQFQAAGSTLAKLLNVAVTKYRCGITVRQRVEYRKEVFAVKDETVAHKGNGFKLQKSTKFKLMQVCGCY